MAIPAFIAKEVAEWVVKEVVSRLRGAAPAAPAGGGVGGGGEMRDGIDLLAVRLDSLQAEHRSSLASLARKEEVAALAAEVRSLAAEAERRDGEAAAREARLKTLVYAALAVGLVNVILVLLLFTRS